MISVEKKDRKRLSKFFKDYKWNYLPDAILEGHVGEALVDNKSNPGVAVLKIPKLKLFIPGGSANHPAARDFLAHLPKLSSLIFASGGWEESFKEIQAGKFFGMQRYTFNSEKLDINYLRKLVSQIPNGYQLTRMDLNMTQKLTAEKSSFASGHLLNFDSPEDFFSRGFGFCILERDEIASVATTFIISSGGIEIQVSTREKQRRKGLATAAAAQLLIHSLQNGLNPNWDAENEKSAKLAQKLGYIPQGNYHLWLYAGSKPLSGFLKVALKIKEIIEQ